jgi:HEAT repeat protein
MQVMNSHGIFAKFMRRLRSVMSAFSERPSVRLDDYVLEHFLYYHGLIGTTPENQKSFRDVRADIRDATARRSSTEMSIALKLPPLLWEEKLQSIFAEMDRTAAIDSLLPEGSEQEIAPSADPLRNEDWQVQANAAKMLAFLGVTTAVPRISRAFEIASADKLASFGHLASALGTLRTLAAKADLEKHLYDSEPWFRVDAANALASWPMEETGRALAKAMLQYHTLSDYMAVVIGRKQSVAAYLAAPDEDMRAGGEEMIVGILSASQSTFSPEIVKETGVDDCWPRLAALYEQQPTPRVIRALLMMARWLENNEHTEWLNEARSLKERITTNPEVTAILVSRLTEAGNADPNKFDATSSGDVRDAIILCGELRQESAVPALVKLLQPEFPHIDEVVDALGATGSSDAAPQLVRVANNIVDQTNRSRLTPSKQPVVESDPDAARTYWHILRALGHLPHKDALPLLLSATSDHAPDKRQQALDSIIEVYERLPDKTPGQNQVEQTITRMLEDPSTPVKLAALDGVSRLRIAGVLPEIVKLCDARENSLSKKAFQTLEELYRHGHKEVVGAVETRLKHEHNSYKRRQLEDFLRPLR